MRNLSRWGSSAAAENRVDPLGRRDRCRRLMNSVTSHVQKTTRFRRYCNMERTIRLVRIPLSVSVLSLSFNLHYPIWTYHVALAGVVLFWGVIQTFDMDGGGVPEINVTIHICLDAILTIISITMGFNLGLICGTGGSGCGYWWVMCLWDNLAIFNGLLVYYSMKTYPRRRQGNRKLTPRIMFTSSGAPVAVVSDLATSVRLTSIRHSIDSLCLPESENDDANRG
ncbi:hypothetical protein F4781DRAFT_417234 [Annulohypoxylon bovei var. microspora]|nr:hypothetical protein F4781DRAFT_417234 [Annulohypoxylon bovei var. microspora]